MTDHFSTVARQYAEARPTYPAALFDWLASLTPARDQVWDAGAGSGQASLALAERFQRVQALHWFNLDAFYAEVRRVLKPEGVIAVWSYGLLTTDDDDLTQAVMHLHNDIVGPYWPPQRHDVENGYANLAFPFTALPVPDFVMTAQWDLHRLLGYFRSWSATARMEKDTGDNPIDGYAPVLQALWGDPERVRPITWPLLVKAGEVTA